MSVHINITDEWAITSDKYQWIVSRKAKGKDKKTGKPVVVWRGESHHTTLGQAIRSLRSRLLRDCAAQSAVELLEEAEKINELLVDKLHPLLEWDGGKIDELG